MELLPMVVDFWGTMMDSAVTRRDVAAVLRAARGNRIQLLVAGVGHFIGHFADANGEPPNSTWRLEDDFLCSHTNQIVPLSLIEEFVVFQQDTEPAAPYRLDAVLNTLDCANRVRPIFLSNEEDWQLHTSGQRLRYALQNRLPESLRKKHNFPYIETTTYTKYGIDALKLVYSDSLRMPIPIPKPTNVTEILAGDVRYSIVNGEYFYRTPPRFTGRVRLYTDTEYLKNTIEIQKLSRGGLSFPIVGWGLSLSTATSIGMQRIYDEIERRPTNELTAVTDVTNVRA